MCLVSTPEAAWSADNRLTPGQAMVAPIAATARGMAVESMAPIRPIRNVLTGVSLPGQRVKPLDDRAGKAVFNIRWNCRANVGNRRKHAKTGATSRVSLVDSEGFILPQYSCNTVQRGCSRLSPLQDME